MTNNQIDNIMRHRASLTLTRRQNAALLCKVEDAVVSYPEFNPYRAVQPLAVVSFPVFVNHKHFDVAVSVFEDGEKFDAVF